LRKSSLQRPRRGIAPRRGAVAPARRIDALDREIIAALQENGRASFRGIAARLGVSEATVWARYARLTREGMLHVAAITKPLGLGFEQALVGVETSAAPDAVADLIARWPEAGYVVVTAGRFDIVVEVLARDRHDLLALTNRVRALDGVASIEVLFYLVMRKRPCARGTTARKERDP
jgi:Lrp/AsnC family transcriptional regulator, regulator for asnA, asnC and gidA